MSLVSDENHRLLLYAKPVELRDQAVDELVKSLADIGFIGQPCHDLDTDYASGDHFMSLITFLGCSPDIALSPQDGDTYSFIRFHEITATPLLYTGKNTPAPHCRQCRKAREDWRHCQQDDYCDQCTLAERAENLVWRKHGALSRWVMEVMNVYPHEAVPSSQLLDSLEAASGIQWGYAYLQA